MRACMRVCVRERKCEHVREQEEVRVREIDEERESVLES